MNRIVHFEIQAEDPDRAQKFYTDVFGWEFKKWEGPIDYRLITTGPEGSLGINGGLLPRRGGTPENGASVNAYVCVVEVEDIDKTMAAAEKAGGTQAMSKQAVPGVGWSAYYKDTEGNIFGLMQSDENAK